MQKLLQLIIYFSCLFFFKAVLPTASIKNTCFKLLTLWCLPCRYRGRCQDRVSAFTYSLFWKPAATPRSKNSGVPDTLLCRYSTGETVIKGEKKGVDFHKQRSGLCSQLLMAMPSSLFSVRMEYVYIYIYHCQDKKRLYQKDNSCDFKWGFSYVISTDMKSRCRHLGL